jgi:hypothetical protein
MHSLEELAFQKGYTQVGMGVGLYQDYGLVQKLYIQFFDLLKHWAG